MSLAIIAGSGLGDLSRVLQVDRVTPFDQIPGVGAAMIAGHAGEILTGSIDGRPCQLLRGRRHFYEGDAGPIDALIDHVVREGATTLLVTSAAGSLRRWIGAGELVVIHDIIDHQNRRALAGRGVAKTARAAPMRGIKVDLPATRLFEEAATAAKVSWQRGISFCTSGPLYETVADVELLQYADADVATMSGAPEVTRANVLGLAAVAVAVVTNPCTGINASVPSHEEVLEAGRHAAIGLSAAIRQFVLAL